MKTVLLACLLFGIVIAQTPFDNNRQLYDACVKNCPRGVVKHIDGHQLCALKCQAQFRPKKLGLKLKLPNVRTQLIIKVLPRVLNSLGLGHLSRKRSNKSQETIVPTMRLQRLLNDTRKKNHTLLDQVSYAVLELCEEKNYNSSRGYEATSNVTNLKSSRSKNQQAGRCLPVL